MGRQIYDKPCEAIMTQWLVPRLSGGRTISRSEILEYMQEHWPKLKRTTVVCHIVKLTTNDPTRVHYSADQDDDILLRESLGMFRLYEAERDPPPIYPGSVTQRDDKGDAEREEGQEFAYESDLRDFLARHLTMIEPGLKLYEDERINGVEFPAGDRRIDILAQDRDGRFVVIELKVSRGHERVVGQMAYYLAWVKQNLSEGQPVRGVIVAREVTDELKMALSILPDVAVYHYELKVTLNKE
jgi:hypothetical protein